ncbi:hypothetical protein GGTG_00123 [Gaeumannomyces tritici R3-111a-1]|uniref:Uncharacterized protein n=1 Tax=Gaeumannomyces tritici (strain R3-111a-1) TaxID=644352 RepID=J3NFS9_GAET3|nr:hypothetical protein GGTG_00123 [Gaeumannomyces tritici R3-111a-1]EJT80119.1 hypothetical protein GGTG_00123 [Gaeumannomyces tritici R3-111a-1]
MSGAKNPHKLTFRFGPSKATPGHLGSIQKISHHRHPAAAAPAQTHATHPLHASHIECPPPQQLSVCKIFDPPVGCPHTSPLSAAQLCVAMALNSGSPRHGATSGFLSVAADLFCSRVGVHGEVGPQTTFYLSSCPQRVTSVSRVAMPLRSLSPEPSLPPGFLKLVRFSARNRSHKHSKLNL